MPPRSLFDGSHRPDRLVMPACDECNKGTSTADLVVSLASRWSHEEGSPQSKLDHARLQHEHGNKLPIWSQEWTNATPEDEQKARLHLIKKGVSVPLDAEIATIGPRTVPQFNLFAHKAVLALYFEHFRQPLRNIGCFCAFWRTKEDFSATGIPSVFLKMLPGYGTLIQGRWNEQKTFEYRHALNLQQGLFGCLARFRQGFFVFGFAAADATVIPPNSMDWVKPSDLLSLLNSPKFLKRR